MDLIKDVNNVAVRRSPETSDGATDVNSHGRDLEKKNNVWKPRWEDPKTETENYLRMDIKDLPMNKSPIKSGMLGQRFEATQREMGQRFEATSREMALRFEHQFQVFAADIQSLPPKKKRERKLQPQSKKVPRKRRQPKRH